ncbi:MAG TPA: hypothetical protein VLG47_02195 [Candidatus Saccharimonadales bacterium]|nr:hypothetical protein [Candidatus Saccharimonadales bacterium]
MPEIYKDVRIVPARRSEQCALPVRIALVDYRMVGIHEHAHPARVLAYLQSFLQHGYRAPAVSVFQQQSDKIFSILPNDQPTTVVLQNYGHLGVADGHHRFAAITLLDKLGLLRTATIPVQVIPVRDYDLVRFITKNIGSHLGNHDVQQLAIADIEACFYRHNTAIPENLATMFEVRFYDGTYDRIKLGQPDIVIDRSDLLKNVLDLDKLTERVEDLESRRLNLPSETEALIQRLYHDLSKGLDQK